MSLLRTSVLLASTALTAGAFARQDYTSLPLPASQVHEALSGRQPLIKLIEAAQSETGGLAREAAPSGGGMVTVHTYTADAHWVVQVDGGSGKVASKELRPRFPGVAVEGEPTVGKSGLRYYDIVKGRGERPKTPRTRVKVHYTGWLIDGTKFDSSVDSGEPLTHGLNEFIPGWQKGVGSMRVGGKRKLIIPHNLAYGELGSGQIPPRATLIFDIELLEIVE